MKFTTPMMIQYSEIKSEYPDALLFFRLGDFYELFMEDAKIGAEVLDITLTARPRGKDGKIPMAGVPYHAVDSYLSKLVKAGYKVAICEQIGEPDKKGIVDREVVRVVTPGTVMDEKSLNRKQNNFIISLLTDNSFIALAACDVSTGYFEVFQKETDNHELDIIEEITRILPAECILPEKLYKDPQILKALKHHNEINIFEYKNWQENKNNAEEFLKNHFQVATLNHFNLQDKNLAKKAAANLILYLKETQKSNLAHIKKIVAPQESEYVSIDRSTLANLEIFSSLRDRETKGSLLSVIDKTKTAMGGRLLKRWLLTPLKSKDQITNRLDFVEELINKDEIQAELSEILKDVNDLERIIARVASGLANPRDLISLKESLRLVLKTKHKLVGMNSDLAQDVQTNISVEIKNVIELIENSIVEAPPVQIKEGGIIRPGFDTKLDEIKNKIAKDRNWILSLEDKEKKRTGISTLKVGFNKVFGYYIEISQASTNKAPHDYTRKQTLVNAERYITPELKRKEQKILTADEKINAREFELFKSIVDQIVQNIETIQVASQEIATLDVILGFSVLAYENNYTKPKILYSNEIRISKGRHPVVESLITETKFVPNDISINPAKTSLLLITGPNMAGKSVFMRQVAIIVLMAQIGSFVPATRAHIGIVDKIFVRSGASDVIASGISTFMLEMVEAAYILNNATKRSLIIMDEIGRGTSTYDGISIAWAVAEFLVKDISPKTLFATHYHELQKLEEKYPKKIANYSMQIENKNGEPVFLYTFEKGPANHSFGIAVAKMAGVPKKVIKRAQKILTELEENSSLDNEKDINTQKILNKVNIENTTPLEALKILEKLKKA